MDRMIQGNVDEPVWGDGRDLSLGWPEPLGSIGIDRRLALLDGIRPLRGRSVLDIGCGNGSYTERLAAGFDRVVGVEVERARLEDFSTRLADRPDRDRFELRLESAEALSDPDGSFDAVIAVETLEHVVDAEAAAAEAFRVLRPGGAFYITVPNRGFPFETHSFMVRGRERRSKWYPFVPWVKPLHRRISTARNYRPADLRALLGPLGLREVGTTFLMPPLERWGPGRHLRRPITALEATPLRHLGVSVVAVFERPGRVEGPDEPVIDLRDRATDADRVGARSDRPVATSSGASRPAGAEGRGRRTHR